MDGLGGLLGRLGRYGRARARAEVVEGWLRAQAERAADRQGFGRPGRPARSERAQFLGRDERYQRSQRMAGCSLWLWFRHYVMHPDQPVKLHSGAFCQQRLLCQPCALHRSAKLTRSYVGKLAALVSGGLWATFVTLTARNGECLAERWRHVDQALRRLFKSGKAAGIGRGLVEGGVFSFETKRGEGTRGGLWHPHLHGVLLSRAPLGEFDAAAGVADREAAQLVREWCKLTGDSDERGQHVRALDSMRSWSSEAAAERDLAGGIGHDLLEVFKYPLKLTALEPADHWTAFQALRNRHLIRPFGCLWGFEPGPGFADEFDAGDLPYVELLFRYGQGAYFAVSSLDDTREKC